MVLFSIIDAMRAETLITPDPDRVPMTEILFWSA